MKVYLVKMNGVDLFGGPTVLYYDFIGKEFKVFTSFIGTQFCFNLTHAERLCSQHKGASVINMMLKKEETL